MEIEIRETSSIKFKVGDEIEIIDEGSGLNYGRLGDCGLVERLEQGVTGKMARVILTTGRDKGQIVTRFIYRLKLARNEWD